MGCKRVTQPCLCGYHNHPERDCLCAPQQIHRYLGRISGPLLDRIDLHVEVTPVRFEELSDKRDGESSEQIRDRVVKARQLQEERFSSTPEIHCNAMMSPRQVREYCKIDAAGEALMKTALQKLGLSGRAYDRILKVARTIADLDHKALIQPNHLAEAIQYRSLDRESWAA